MATILVIDDDPALRRMIERVLRRGGHEVELAENGIAGLHAFRRRKPDLVITDILMPVKEGLDTIRLLRDWAPELKIVAISGGSPRGGKDPVAAALEFGATSFVAKPFEPAALLDEVARCLDRAA
jgi:CheY-like chemotaxis protein